MKRSSSESDDGWVGQSEAARLVGCSDRTIRRWLKRGRLHPRGTTDSRVQLRKVEKLVDRKKLAGQLVPREDGKLGRAPKHSGRPLGRQTNPWLLRISQDANGFWLCDGQPISASKEVLRRLRTKDDVARFLEIRILANLMEGAYEEYSTRKLLAIDQFTQLPGGVRGLRPILEERMLDEALARASWWEIRVLKARFLYKVIQMDPPPQELGDRPITKRQIEEIQRQARREMIEDMLRPKTELRTPAELNEHLARTLPNLYDHETYRIAAFLGHDGRRGLTFTEFLAELQTEIMASCKAGKLNLAPRTLITNNTIAAIRQKRKREGLETKWGRLAHGLEPVRGTKRRYPFHSLIDDRRGISRRMGTYWKQKTDTLWQRFQKSLASQQERLAFLEHGRLASGPKALAPLSAEIKELFSQVSENDTTDTDETPDEIDSLRQAMAFKKLTPSISGRKP